MIYAIRDADANVRYVGKTAFTAEERLVKHRRDDAKTRHLPVARWLTKHPEAYVTTLEVTDDANAAEVRWIAYFGLDALLNCTPGGDGGDTGYYWSDEARRVGKIARDARSPEAKRASALKMLETRRRNSVHLG